jgi:hypothetical protein
MIKRKRRFTGNTAIRNALKDLRPYGRIGKTV